MHYYTVRPSRNSGVYFGCYLGNLHDINVKIKWQVQRNGHNLVYVCVCVYVPLVLHNLLGRPKNAQHIYTLTIIYIS